MSLHPAGGIPVITVPKSLVKEQQKNSSLEASHGEQACFTLLPADRASRDRFAVSGAMSRSTRDDVHEAQSRSIAR